MSYNTDALSLAVYNGNLYAGTRHGDWYDDGHPDGPLGGEVWRSSDGTTWTQRQCAGLRQPGGSSGGDLDRLQRTGCMPMFRMWEARQTPARTCGAAPSPSVRSRPTGHEWPATASVYQPISIFMPAKYPADICMQPPTTATPGCSSGARRTASIGRKPRLTMAWGTATTAT